MLWTSCICPHDAGALDAINTCKWPDKEHETYAQSNETHVTTLMELVTSCTFSSLPARTDEAGALGSLCEAACD